MTDDKNMNIIEGGYRPTQKDMGVTTSRSGASQMPSTPIDDDAGYSGYMRQGLNPHAVGRRSYVFGETPKSARHGEKAWEIHKRVMERYANSRLVYRGVVPQAVIEDILNNDKTRDMVSELEAAVPLEDYGMPESWLVSMGHNDTSRSSIREVKGIIERTTRETALIPEPPIDKVRLTAETYGYRFIDRIPEGKGTEGLLDLWSETFGWTPEEIKIFRNALEKDMLQPSGERRLWFTGALSPDGRLEAASMAIRSDISGKGGKSLPYVESTEWCRKRNGNGVDDERKPVMAANLAVLNAQVLESIGEQKPFIFAECNIEPQAYRPGYKAGFQIPSRRFDIAGHRVDVPQVLIQNVKIGDGIDIPSDYRDFVLMQLKPEAIQRYYSPEARREMLSYVKQ